MEWLILNGCIFHKWSEREKFECLKSLDTKSFFWTWRDFVQKVIWLFPTLISFDSFCHFHLSQVTEETNSTSSSKKKWTEKHACKVAIFIPQWPQTWGHIARQIARSWWVWTLIHGQNRFSLVDDLGVFIVSGITWMVGFWTEDFQGQRLRRYQGFQDNLWEGKVTWP